MRQGIGISALAQKDDGFPSNRASNAYNMTGKNHRHPGLINVPTLRSQVSLLANMQVTGAGCHVIRAMGINCLISMLRSWWARDRPT